MLSMIRIVVIAFICCVGVPAQSAEIAIQVEPRIGDTFREAQFRLSLPDVRPVLGLLVIVQATKYEGAKLTDSRWKELASDLGCGLLVCNFYNNDVSFPYDNAANGSGYALQSALLRFSQASGISNLPYIPLLMVGISEGGQFAYSYALWKPKSVIALVSIKGSHFDEPATSEIRKIPALFFMGEEDADDRRQRILQIFRLNRHLNAHWCLAIEENSQHGVDRCPELIVPFLKDALRWNRQPAPKDESALLGDISNKKSYSYSTFPGDRLDASWLPGRESARAWENFVRSQDISKLSLWSLDSPPSVPLIDVSPRVLDIPKVDIDFPPIAETVTVTKVRGCDPWDEVVALPTRLGHFDSKVHKVGSDTWTILVVPIVSGPILGQVEDALPIRLRNRGKDVLGGFDLSIKAMYCGKVEYSPKTAYFGTMQPNQRKVLSFSIHSKDNSPILIDEIKIDSERGIFRIIEVDKVDNTAVIRLEALAGSEPCEFKGQISATVTSKVSYLLTIPIVGKVIE